MYPILLGDGLSSRILSNYNTLSCTDRLVESLLELEEPSLGMVQEGSGLQDQALAYWAFRHSLASEFGRYDHVGSEGSLLARTN